LYRRSLQIAKPVEVLRRARLHNTLHDLEHGSRIIAAVQNHVSALLFPTLLLQLRLEVPLR